MFNMKPHDRPADPKDAGKPALKPAVYDPPSSVGRAVANAGSRTAGVQAPAPHREGLPPAPAFPLRDDAHHAAASPAATTSHAPAASRAPAPAAEAQGSKLFVGVNIKLKGVEITDCDVLVIEGHVEATVTSKVMQIAQPGTLKGVAMIDVAEVDGEFTGELTARSRLIVHGTGRVSGTVRYGQLVVSEGGEVSGDVKPIEASDKHSQHSRAAPDQLPGTSASR